MVIFHSCVKLPQGSLWVNVYKLLLNMAIEKVEFPKLKNRGVPQHSHVCLPEGNSYRVHHFIMTVVVLMVADAFMLKNPIISNLYP